MDFVMGLIRAGLTLAAVALLIALMAALFMVLFKLATDIDDRIAD